MSSRNRPALGLGLGPAMGRRNTSLQTGTPPPSSQPTHPATAKYRDFTTAEAKKELTDRKLILHENTVTFNSLIDILLSFTGREQTEDGLGEPWEIVRAVGRLLDTEMGKMVSQATADATVNRMLSLREAERAHAASELEAERSRIAAREEVVRKLEDGFKDIADRQQEERIQIEEEWKQLEVEKGKEKEKVGANAENEEGEIGNKLDTILGKLGGLLDKIEKQGGQAPLGAATGFAGAAGVGGGGGTGFFGAMGWGEYEGFGGQGFGDDGGWGAGGGMAGGPSSYAEAARLGGQAGQAWGRGPAPGTQTRDDVEGEERLRRAEGKRARQLMLDASSVAGREGLKGLKSEDLLEKAFKALNEIVDQKLLEGWPEKVEFVGAASQRQGGVLYELSSKEVRDWLVRPDVCEKFTEGFGHAVQIRQRKFPVLAEFVPVEFDASGAEAIKDIEDTNDLPKGSILALKWVRDLKRREPEQRHAHLIVYCNSKETANDWIYCTRTIQGRSVASVKLMPEPMRCYNCQLDGHQAKQCASPTVCGSCGGEHKTELCTNRKNLYCVTCKEKGHPTWSTACPQYVTRCTNLTDRIPDNRYRYYVTSKEWTWELLSNDANWRRFHAPRPRRDPQPNATGANTVPTPPKPSAEHPRPDNLAQPTPGGSTINPRQGTLSGWVATANTGPTQQATSSTNTNANATAGDSPNTPITLSDA